MGKGMGRGTARPIDHNRLAPKQANRGGGTSRQLKRQRTIHPVPDQKFTRMPPA